MECEPPLPAHSWSLVTMQAKSICSTDPMVWNELAVLAFRNGDLDSAARWLHAAMQLVPQETGLMQRATLPPMALTLMMLVPP